ncbi:MAG TPA: YciI family protein [Kofleriaceae bacterium]|nr:YciI family protein [Kofleriaceae bacterium]
MQYLCLIYENESIPKAMSESEQQQYFGEYFSFTNEVKEKGLFVGGEALQPVATATTVRVREGKVITTDGPFAETKEQLGGYYLLDCKDLDEAIAAAAKIPGARFGSIEVRPLMVFEQ